MQDYRITESSAIKSGFSFQKRYEHDEWETFRYVKDRITLEFTYVIQTGKLVSIGTTINQEIIDLDLSEQEILVLSRILNRK